VFSSLSVLENLEMGSYRSAARAQRAEGLDSVYGLFPVLRERRTQLAGSLSGGEQQMLAIGRGLMARPDLLLLDEPSQGLGPRIVEIIFVEIDGRHHQLAPRAIGDADHVGLLDRGMAQQHGLHLERGHVDAARLIISFSRPRKRTRPSSPMRPRSPVTKDPSASKAARVCS